MCGPVDGVDAQTDHQFLTPEGTNIKKGAGVVTLDYSEVEWLSQQFATRTESVTPFLVSFWQLSVKLTPNSDTWTDTARIKAKITKIRLRKLEQIHEIILAKRIGTSPKTFRKFLV